MYAGEESDSIVEEYVENDSVYVIPPCGGLIYRACPGGP
jgi:hypothetical protein